MLMLLAFSACERPEPSAEVSPPLQVLVVTDGRMDEWGSVGAVLEDPEDAPGDTAVELGRVRVADDARWLHLAVAVGRPVNAQRMRGTLRILFDADGDPATGAEVEAMTGVDAIVELSRRDRETAQIGAGNGIRPVTSVGPGELIGGYAAGLLSAPTYSAPEFEIRLNRGAEIEGLPRLFVADRLRLKLVFEDAAGLRDETDVATYELTTGFGSEPASVFEPSIAKGEGVLRVVHWNVAGENLRTRQDSHLRILAALDPDVVLFDEIYGTVTRQEMESFFRREPLAALGDWRFVLGASGGRQKNLVASRRSIRPEDDLLDVAYPKDELEGLAGQVGDDPEFRELLERERERGLATAGAWVELGEGREALFVPLDLQSAGYDGSPRDRLRELQAKTLRERLASIVEPRSSALVVGGDLNLVGSIRPLEALRRGLDAGNDLAVSEAYRFTERSQATWRDPGEGDYTPGRLDFLLFSASQLEFVRAFIFDSEELSDGYLGRLGVERSDSKSASHHLPGVADFAWP